MNVSAPFEQLLTLSQHTSKTLAKVGFLLIVIAVAGTLLMTAFHWGQFG